MNSVPLLTCATGAALGLLLAVALLWRKNRFRENAVLAALVMLAALDIFVAFAKQALLANVMTGDLVPVYINLLFAPLLLQFLSTPVTRIVFTSWRWLEFGLFAVFQCVALVELWTKAALPWITIHRVMGAVVTLVLIMYLAKCVRIVLIAKTQDGDWREFHNRNIAQASLIGMELCQLMIVIAPMFFLGQVVEMINNQLYSVMACLLIILTYSFLYKAVSHSQSVDTPDLCKEKYGNNRLPDFVKDSIIAGLIDYMMSKAPWLDVNLTLSQLADSINVNSHHLSQIINSHFGKSFACFINEYRVNAACELLAACNSKTVLEIALESGFSSKSSFNTLFKKQTGLTPSEYRKKFQNINYAAA